MKTIKKFRLIPILLSLIVAINVSCEGEDGLDGINGVDGSDGRDGRDGEDAATTATPFENKSDTSPLVALRPQFNFVNAFSLISTPDVIRNPDGSNFQLAGSADGAGFLRDGDGFIYVVNNEDSYAVSRLRLDRNLNVTSGDYLLNSGVGDFARQCSGTMLEAEIHGGGRDIFLSASESINFDVKGIDPRIQVPTPQADFGLDALGEFSWENAVPLPQNAYAGETVIIGGDDDSSGSEGQITLYHSTSGSGDLDGGSIYVLKATEISDGNGGVIQTPANTIAEEDDFDFGVSYGFEFVEILNGSSLTKSEMENASDAVFATRFVRVEDIDYQKGSAANNRNVFVAVTGRGPGRGTVNDWGTVYKLELDENSPLTGRMTQIISGNTTGINNGDGNLSQLQSPDNICVTENFIYLQEDPNSFSRGHAAYIYQSDLNGNNINEVLELVVRQDLDPNNSTGFNGEFGSLIDISDKIGIEGTFLLALQPHYWEDPSFAGLDGHINSTFEDDQASQIVILQNLPR